MAKMFTENVFELIRETATNLPNDVVEALIQARNLESKGSRGKLSLGVILKNIQLARSQKTPICQDTGSPTFYVRADPKNWKKIEKSILAATKKATKEGILRANAVDPINAKNVGNLPSIKFEADSSAKTEISLLLKGGGSENVSAQLSLPLETDFGFAARDLDGVKKAVLQTVKNAGGKGCAPGILSVAIGGDRASGFALAKKNLLKKIGAKNSDSKLAKLEAEILREANKLKIGTMGLGGKTTLLDCKVAALPRHPASFFVTVVYSCWATRRGVVVLNAQGKVLKNSFSKKVLHENLDLTKVKKIQLPISEAEVRKLKVGEIVSVSGKLFTARDRVHELAMKKKLPKSLKNLGVFHCGPIMVRGKNQWMPIATGPTTSARLETFTPKFLAKTGARVLIGKGGMGEATAKALKKHGGVYLHAIGGSGAFYANSVRKVSGVNFLKEFGAPEAMWEIEVEDFLAIVGIDAKGKMF